MSNGSPIFVRSKYEQLSDNISGGKGSLLLDDSDSNLDYQRPRLHSQSDLQQDFKFEPRLPGHFPGSWNTAQNAPHSGKTPTATTLTGSPGDSLSP